MIDLMFSINVNSPGVAITVDKGQSKVNGAKDLPFLKVCKTAGVEQHTTFQNKVPLHVCVCVCTCGYSLSYRAMSISLR